MDQIGDQVLAESQSVSRAPATARPAPELTIVVPTFNERANIPLLVGRLRRTLEGIDWEVLFVDDDSPDRTAAAVRALGEQDARVRCLRRVGRRGLAGACLEGILASQARYVAVMDADLQHDEALLVGMLERLRAGDTDLVVASRYVGEGSAAGLAGRRASYSRWSTEIARRLLKVGLTGVFIHMAALVVALDLGGLTFGPAQTAATVIAIAWNFTLNNALTYRDQRLSGWSFVTGLLRFQVICAVGAISNVGIASAIYGYDPEEWLLAGLGGAVMGAVWNYVVSAAFVWRAR